MSKLNWTISTKKNNNKDEPSIHHDCCDWLTDSKQMITTIGRNQQIIMNENIKKRGRFMSN